MFLSQGDFSSSLSQNAEVDVMYEARLFVISRKRMSWLSYFNILELLSSVFGLIVGWSDAWFSWVFPR
jgi:hypothetical protein